MSAPASRTYHSIDILKVVAALLVVAIHARPFVGKTYPLCISLFSRMAVPVFFVVSAFFFFRKKPDGAQLKHYVRRMGWLYAFWFVVEAYITIDAVFFSHDRSVLESFSHFICGFFLNSTFSGSWFIMALIICIPLLHWLGKRLNTWAIFGIGLAVYVPVTLTTNYHAYMPQSVQHATNVAFNVIGLFHNSFMPAIVFCSIGKLIAEYENRIAKFGSLATTTALLLCMVGAWAEVAGHKARFDDCYFMLIPTAAAIVVWTLHHEVNWHLPYKTLRNFSTITYFSHFIFVWFLTGKGIFSPVATYFVIVALCVITTLLLLHLSRRFPLLTYAY